MTRMMIIIGLVSMVVSITSLVGVRCGWFWKTPKPTVAASTTRTKEEADAAARHCRCQPRHWRYLMLQQQQP